MSWQAVVETPLGAVQTQLLQRVLERLDPVEFKPWWVQATIGISYAVQEKFGSLISSCPDFPSRTWKKHWSE